MKAINNFDSNLDTSKDVFEKHAQSVQTNMNIYSKYIKFSVNPDTFETSVSSDFRKMTSDQEFINAFALLEINWRANCIFNRDLLQDARHLRDDLEKELSTL